MQTLPDAYFSKSPTQTNFIASRWEAVVVNDFSGLGAAVEK